MVNSKRAATYYPDNGPHLWHIRWYWRKHIFVSHGMPRGSALALARTMRECGIPTVVIPSVENVRPI
jgi:hypothetical protein